MEFKNNLEWLHHYFEITPSGVLVLKNPYYVGSIKPAPELYMEIPQTMMCYNESITHKRKRIEKETKKIDEDIRKQIDAGEITEEEAEELRKERIGAIPNVLEVKVKSFSGRASFSKLHYYFLKKFSSELKSKISDVGIKGYEQFLNLCADMIKLYGPGMPNEKFTEEKMKYLLSLIPDISEIIENMSNGIRKLIDDYKKLPGLEGEEHDKLVNIDDKVIDQIIKDIINNEDIFSSYISHVRSWFTTVTAVEEHYGIPESVAGNIINSIPDYRDAKLTEWFLEIFQNIYFFTDLEFETVVTKDENDKITTTPHPFTSFGSNCLDGFRLDNISLPNRLNTINYRGLAHTNVESICVTRKLFSSRSGEAVLSLDKDSYACFSDSSKLKELGLGNRTTYYPERMCRGCVNLEKHDYSSNLEKIGHYAFFECEKFDNKKFPKKLKIIGDGAFCNSGMSGELNINDTILNIGRDAFAFTSVSSLSIGTTKLSYRSFAVCKDLESVKFREGCTSANLNAFNGCSNLKTIEIPRSVETIGLNFGSDSAFHRESDSVMPMPKFIYYGKPEELMDVKIIDYFNLADSVRLGDINDLNGLHSGELTLSFPGSRHDYSDVGCIIGIEFAYDRVLEKNIAKIYEETGLDKDKLVKAFGELIDEGTDMGDLFAASFRVNEHPDPDFCALMTDVESEIKKNYGFGGLIEMTSKEER